MQFKKSILMLAPTLLLASCLGGGSSSSNSGGPPVGGVSSQFIDDPVVGLNYIGKKGSSGVTGSNGMFSCHAGEIVVFKLGKNIDLGEAVCGEKVFLQNLSSSAHASKIGALLQSFGIENGQIVIPSEVRQKALPAVTISSLDDNSIDDFFADPALSSLSIAPVTIAQAQTNIDNSLTTYLQLPSELSSSLDILSSGRTAAYSPSMDPSNPTYSLSDTRVIPTHSCDADIEFQFGIYKSSGLYYAEMYSPAEIDDGDVYQHKTYGHSLVAGETFGIGGSSTCMDENNAPIACSFSLTAKIDVARKKLVGTFYMEIPSDNIKCTATVNQTLNF